jgi:hypothetical protein
MTKKSRVAIGVAALTVMTLGVGGFLAKAQIGAIMNKSPARERPMQRAQEDVLAAFGQIEKALRDGDGVRLASLMARRAPPAATLKVGYDIGVPQPGLRLEPIAVCVRGDQAFVVARYEAPASNTGSYLVRYAREDGAWKIADQTTSDAPPYRPAVYAYLPPDGGAFTHAGLPWRAIPHAAAGRGNAEQWKVQAIRDENYLHLRFEAKASLPAHQAPIPEADAGRAPAAPPRMLVTVTMTDDRQTIVRSTFELQVAAAVASRVTQDATGKAETQRVTAYAMVLRGDHDETLFDSSPGAFNRLVEIRDRFIDVRLPLKSLGLHGRSVPEIDLRRVDTPELTPYRVARFSP